MRIYQPIPETAGRVATPDGTAEPMPYQIVVMVSIAAKRVIELPSDAPRFPAVLDTGNNHNFAIRQGAVRSVDGSHAPETRVGERRRQDHPALHGQRLDSSG